MNNNNNNAELRYWIEAGKSYLCERGYFPYCSERYLQDNKINTLEEIKDAPCLVLLGEACSGKTFAINQILTIHEKSSHEKVYYLDLTALVSGEDIKSFFNEVNEFAYSNPLITIFMYLDGFDECQYYIPNIKNILGHHLKTYKELFLKIHFRIASRSFSWPETLQSDMEKVWGKDNLKLFEILPFTLQGLKQNIGSEINAQEFIEDLFIYDIAFLALKPITLNFLKSQYKNRHFSTDVFDLTLSSFRLLMNENNLSYKSMHLDKLNAEQKLIVASRIAYILTFSQKESIWLGLDLQHKPENALSVEELMDYKEGMYQYEIALTENHLKQVLATSIFTLRGKDLFGFPCAPYQEFLTAYYLLTNKVSLKRILPLVEFPITKDIRPQFYGAVKHLVGKNSELVTHLLENDVSALLHGLQYIQTDEQKAKIIYTCIKNESKIRSLYPSPDIRVKLGLLEHKKLYEQLKPVIRDDEYSEDIQWFAFDIIEGAKSIKFAPDLVKIIKDEKKTTRIRKYALYALRDMEAPLQKKKLKDLLLGSNLPQDEEDELRGYLLQILWPNFINLDELLKSITPVKRKNLIGSYSSFLYEDITAFINTPSEIIKTLEWANKKNSEDYYYSFIPELKDKLFYKAFAFIDNDAIFNLVVNVFIKRSMEFDNIEEKGVYDSIKDILSNDANLRRRLLKSIIDKGLRKSKSFRLIHYFQPLFQNETDIPFYLEQIRRTSGEKKVTYILYARYMFGFYDFVNRDLLLNYYQKHNQDIIFNQYFKHIFGPLDINDKEAREAYNFQQEMTQKSKTTINPERRVIEILEYAETEGQSVAWQQLCRELSLTENSSHYTNFDKDIIELPGWKNAEPDIQERITQAAIKFLNQYEPNPWEWLGTNTYTDSGYKAIRFLYSENKAAFNSLDTKVWDKWTPEILGCLQDKADSMDAYLVNQSYQKSKNIFLKVISVMIERAKDFDSSLFGLRKIECIQDTDLENYVFESFKSSQISNEGKHRLSEYLLKRNNKKIIKYINEKLKNIDECAESSIIFITDLTYQAINYSASLEWKVIWQAIKSSDRFGELLAQKFGWKVPDFTTILKEKELAEWYQWLAEHYPSSEDPDFPGAHQLTSREGIGHLRRGVISQLAGYGTEQAYIQIAKLIPKVPQEANSLHYYLSESKKAQKLPVMTPFETLTWVKNPGSRYIQHSDHLLEVVIESLERLQERILGETPIARQYWDKIEEKKYKPYSETEVSNNLKNHLLDDLSNKGIIVNREVEIRPTIPVEVRSGQQPDLLIQVANKKSYKEESETIQLIVEVKGNWYGKLFDEMERQLTNRYLRNHDKCRTGLYLVVHYPPDDYWIDEDRKRKASSANRQLNTLKQQLISKANELTSIERTVKCFVLDIPLKYST